MSCCLHVLASLDRCLQVHRCPNSDACVYGSRTRALSLIQTNVVALSRKIQASLVLRPAGSNSGGGGGRLLMQGESPSLYGQPYDDSDYSLLLRSAAAVTANYSGSLCADGYRGVLCGACAPGWGSTGPATCHPCPSVR